MCIFVSSNSSNEMYFIVYLEKLNKNVILPSNWIKNIDLHFEKFINRSINRSQAQLCYYTTNAEAFEADNCPRKEWPASFVNMAHDPIDSQPFDGCFFGFLQYFKGKCSEITF